MRRGRVRPARIDGDALLEGLAGLTVVAGEHPGDAAFRQRRRAPEGDERAGEPAGVPGRRKRLADRGDEAGGRGASKIERGRRDRCCRRNLEAGTLDANRARGYDD